MKLRYFYRIDHKKNPIPASNIRRKSKPPGNQWKELINPCCVEDAAEIPCNCGEFKYFVQLDYKGNPVDHTLVKRMRKADSDTGFKFMEVAPTSCCPPVE